MGNWEWSSKRAAVRRICEQHADGRVSEWERVVAGVMARLALRMPTTDFTDDGVFVAVWDVGSYHIEIEDEGGDVFEWLVTDTDTGWLDAGDFPIDGELPDGFVRAIEKAKAAEEA